MFKCSNTQLWSILAAVENSYPFVVSVYCGNSKPDNLNEFLEDFIHEIDHIRLNGIILNGRHFNVIVKCFTCDAPARQFVKGIKSHTGYNGYERCQVVGQNISNRVVYHKTDAPPRTNPEFKQMIYNDHQIFESPLIRLDINLISDFALDYMHLVCLGVTKRLLLFLKEGPRCCRISPSQINQVSERLECYRGQFPSEMARQPRGLSEIKRWKATEFRQFLL